MVEKYSVKTPPSKKQNEANKGGHRRLLVKACGCRATCASVYRHTYSKYVDQPGMVANPARGHLNREY